MPLHLRLQSEWQLDTEFPRDCLCINPAFRVSDTFFVNPGDEDQLCEDLATGLATWDAVNSDMSVTSYDLEGTPPVFPNGSFSFGGVTAPAAPVPREVALCLSFYSEQNVPSKRGRLFIPACVFTTAVGGRPTAAQIAKVASLVPILTGLGGTNVDWGVWSQKNQTFHKATHWWVDDEWDTIRSRGLRATMRSQGTTNE
jgi:hypothetical protein